VIADDLEERIKMERIELTAQSRTVEKRGAKRLRRQGKVPGMLYGRGVGNIPLHMEAIELKRVLGQAGASQLIELRIDEASATQPVLAREIQRDVLSGEAIHVDFYAVSMTERITADVAITLVGEPEAVATAQGILLQGANSILIECLPGNLIPSLEVDVSELELNSAIYVSDLELPGNVEVLADPQELVAQVVPERLEEEEEELEEELMLEEPAEVEVIGRVREEEEEE
jgi:large subunit ribosomal protein L25